MKMWIRKLFEKIKYHISNEWCYDRMEAEGVAVIVCFCGIAGGPKQADYLSEMCWDCPHLVLYFSERKED